MRDVSIPEAIFCACIYNRKCGDVMKNDHVFGGFEEVGYGTSKFSEVELTNNSNLPFQAGRQEKQKKIIAKNLLSY